MSQVLIQPEIQPLGICDHLWVSEDISVEITIAFPNTDAHGFPQMATDWSEACLTIS